jgi:DnaJ-class molecular chaperone
MSETIGEVLFGWEAHIANSMRAQYPCERCDGTGTMKVTGFITRTNGCSAVKDEPMRCLDCDGTGRVTGRTLKMRRVAKFIKEGRLRLDMSQREQARILGLEFKEFNDIIHGRY